MGIDEIEGLGQLSYFLTAIYQPCKHNAWNRLTDYLNHFTSRLNLHQDTRVFFQQRAVQYLIRQRALRKIKNRGLKQIQAKDTKYGSIVIKRTAWSQKSDSLDLGDKRNEESMTLKDSSTKRSKANQGSLLTPKSILNKSGIIPRPIISRGSFRHLKAGNASARQRIDSFIDDPELDD